MPEVSAVVLAGGKSQRLGMDKSLLRFDGEWLLQRILNQLATLSRDLLVVADDADKLGSLNVPIVPDARPGMGPLGAIYSGLQSMRCERGLFVACDMPLLNLPLLQHMIELSPAFDVVIPRVGDETEPLHAIYSKACLSPIADLLERGQRRVIHFFDRVRVRYIGPDEIETFDPDHLSFFNINTPADLQRAQELSRPATPRTERGMEYRREGRPASPPHLSAAPRTLIIGYGNLHRGDDGVAYHVVNALRQRLGQKPLGDDDSGLQELGAQTDSILLVQLVPELTDVLAGYDQVIFVDAHVRDDVPALYCAPISSQYATSPFTHHMTPGMLLALLQALRQREPVGYLVSVRGYDFDFHRGLSPDVGELVPAAVEHIWHRLNPTAPESRR